ncbi:unnamed protein product [Candida verbasci]|uniref:Bud22 domain-containing protein n=1 Tax=Candida verbasci TaxID=1227364 RepID=A0A9W4X818_9ASCO|nr:unnamed protein product [Candida verbasci]
MKSNNQLWKLDLLESKFEKATPRFNHTKKLLLSISTNSTNLVKKLPKDEHEVKGQIKELKKIAFEHKYHSGYNKLEKEINRILKQKPTELLKNEAILNNFIISKILKCIQNSILNSKELKLDPPNYINEEIRSIILDKSNDSNPTGFFKKYCQNDKIANNQISNLSNNKNVKKIMDEIEWSFKMVRGNLTKQEKKDKKKATGGEFISGDEPEEEDDDESNELSEEEEDEEQEVEDDADEDIYLEKAYDNFAVYENDEKEEGEEENFELDPNINYDEITEEEPSEEEDLKDDESEDGEVESEVDDFFEEEPSLKKSKKSKEEEAYNLPELATGYCSGGSDDEGDIDNDKIIKELTSQRKNRRGQRARQKIWEKKYGKNAKHVTQERERIANEREKRRLEFEERERKRQLKAQLQKPTGANNEPIGERKENKETKPREDKIHPSWEAKKQAEAKLKTSFQGKKVVFD